MNPIEFANRAKSARQRMNLTMAQAADLIGCSRPLLAQWESGRSKSLGGRFLLAAARAYQVNPEWLAELTDDDGFPWSGPAAPAAAPTPVSLPATQPGYVRVDQLDATAGMGGAMVNDDHPEIIRSVEYGEAYIRALIGFVPPPGRLKLVSGTGDSMRPIIEPGEPTLMDSGVTTFRGDGVYWIGLGDRDEGHQIKMLQQRGDGLWVVSANPLYPPFPFPEHGRIGGRLYIRHRIERFN